MSQCDAQKGIASELKQEYTIGSDTCVSVQACRYALNCIFKLVKTRIGYFCTSCNQLEGNSVIGALIISTSVIAGKAQSHSHIMMKSILPVMWVVKETMQHSEKGGQTYCNHWSFTPDVYLKLAVRWEKCYCLVWNHPVLPTSCNNHFIISSLQVTVPFRNKYLFHAQIFNDSVPFVCSEVAFGYKGLQIQLFYTAGNLSTLFKVKYSSKVTEVFDCVEVGHIFPFAQKF